MSRLDQFTRHILGDYFSLDPEAHPDLLKAMQPIELPGGQWLFHQHEPGDALYFLIRGRLQAWREDERGKLLSLLGEIGTGEPVGEIGLLTNGPRSAGVRATRDSLLLRIDRATLETLASRAPEVILKVCASVAERLHRTIQTRQRRAMPRTLALLLLDDDPALNEYANRLGADLTAGGEGVLVHPDRFTALGAPVQPAGDTGQLSPALRHWIATLEDDHDRVVFRVNPGDGEWSEYALRQADLLVRLGRGGADPSLRGHERQPDTGMRPSLENSDILLLWHGPGSSRIQGTRKWLEARKHCRPLHVRADIKGDHQRLVRILTGRATGLVFSGGAVRGLSHMGTFKALGEHGIPVDWVGGTSIGACMAACIAQGWDSETAIARVRKAFVGGRPLSDYTLPLISLLSGRRLRKLTRHYLEPEIEDLPIPYFAVSCNLNTGTVNVHDQGPLWHAVCASVSLPGLFPPTVHERQLTVDGAVLNNLPIDIMQQQMVGKIIAVDLDSRREHLVDYQQVPGTRALLAQKIWPFGKRHRVPGMASLILKSIELGSRARSRELSEQADLLIQPPVHRFNMLDVNQYDDLVETGYQCAHAELTAWLERQRDPDPSKSIISE